MPNETADDNGSQYMSRKFQDLTITYNFKYRKSSPEYFESNGPVKSTTQTIKRILKNNATIIESIPSIIGIKINT